MKKYIFLTANIHPIGGMQLYTSGKAKYLEKNGWKVFVVYDGNPLDSFQVGDLAKFNDGAFPIVSLRPNYLSKTILEHMLKRLKKLISFSKEDCICVESHSDILALWGEYIAKKLHAKHVCFNCNEVFRGHNKHYEEYMDFFWFKYKRKELLGLHVDTMNKLFDGYYNVCPSEDRVFDALEQSPIQNVDSPLIGNIPKCDYNIAYLGRATKGYVPKIIEGVADFALKYPQKTINFILIGKADSQKHLLEKRVKPLKNVVLTLTGDLVPIPRSIFSKIDLMIAGAVCAELSAEEGVPTLVADCENYLCNGILGYTVDNSMYFNPKVGQIDFLTGIEQVLIQEIHKGMQFSFLSSKNPDNVYGEQVALFTDEFNGKEYFSFEKKFSLSLWFKAIVKEYFRKLYFKKLKGGSKN